MGTAIFWNVAMNTAWSLDAGRNCCVACVNCRSGNRTKNSGAIFSAFNSGRSGTLPRCPVKMRSWSGNGICLNPQQPWPSWPAGAITCSRISSLSTWSRSGKIWNRPRPLIPGCKSLPSGLVLPVLRWKTWKGHCVLTVIPSPWIAAGWMKLPPAWLSSGSCSENTGQR